MRNALPLYRNLLPTLWVNIFTQFKIYWTYPFYLFEITAVKCGVSHCMVFAVEEMRILVGGLLSFSRGCLLKYISSIQRVIESGKPKPIRFTRTPCGKTIKIPTPFQFLKINAEPENRGGMQMSGHHYPERTRLLWRVFYQYRRMKTSILATAIAILVIFFNEVLAK